MSDFFKIETFEMVTIYNCRLAITSIMKKNKILLIYCIFCTRMEI